MEENDFLDYAFGALQLIFMIVLCAYLKSLGCGGFTILVGLVTFAVIGTVGGWLLGAIVGRRIDEDSIVLDAAIWSNLVFWLFTPFGFAASAFCIKVSDNSGRKLLLCRSLAFIGFLLSSLTYSWNGIETAKERGELACEAGVST